MLLDTVACRAKSVFLGQVAMSLIDRSKTAGEWNLQEGARAKQEINEPSFSPKRDGEKIDCCPFWPHASHNVPQARHREQ